MTLTGRVRPAELRRALAGRRKGFVGPTTIYYAGVTAPVISAAMALVTRTALEHAGANLYWTLMISALTACFAGIGWYVIFMRWSAGNSFGRESETEFESTIRLTGDALVVIRGEVETRIGARAIRGLAETPRHVHVQLEGASDVVIPARWFPDAAARAAFVSALKDMAGLD